MALGIIIVILVVFTLALLHELSHLVVAKGLGFQVPIFGIGLPATPFTKIGNLGGTDLRLHLVPLGLYAVIPELDVQSEGDNETELPKARKSFPLFKKLLVIVSGPLFNFLFALTIMSASLMLLGQPEQKFVIADLSKVNPIAKQAGLLPQDVIISIDSLKSNKVTQITEYISSHPKQKVVLQLLRAGKEIDFPVTPDEHGRIGITIETNFDETAPFRRYSLSEALEGAGSLMTGLGSAYGQYARVGASSDAHPREKVVGHLSALFMLAQEMHDFRKIPLLLAILSFNFGYLHLIPLPGLDGGHFVSVIFNHSRKFVWYTKRPLRWLYVISLTLLFLGGIYQPCLLRGHMTRPK